MIKLPTLTHFCRYFYQNRILNQALSELIQKTASQLRRFPIRPGMYAREGRTLGGCPGRVESLWVRPVDRVDPQIFYACKMTGGGMQPRPPKPYRKPGYRNLATDAGGYCPEHKHLADEALALRRSA